VLNTFICVCIYLYYIHTAYNTCKVIKCLKGGSLHVRVLFLLGRKKTRKVMVKKKKYFCKKACDRVLERNKRQEEI